MLRLMYQTHRAMQERERRPSDVEMQRASPGNMSRESTIQFEGEEGGGGDADNNKGVEEGVA